MNWKDTVMDKILIDASDGLASKKKIKEIRGLLEQQAEISFKAGYNQSVLDNDNWARDTYGYELGKIAGLREVVEFIHKEFGGYTQAVADGGELINILIDNDYGEDGSLDKWQDKLKEWGIE